MMTSVADAARGNRDRVQPQTTHTSQPQKQIQATAEQIRLAQMIYDKNDADFEGKVKQLFEVTGRNQDECIVALHDCNGDVNRAINFLLEEITAKDSWETVGKKKSVGKEGMPAESRERRTDREARGRGGPGKRGRGTGRAQEGRSEENGFDSVQGERAGERGRRGRGRGQHIHSHSHLTSSHTSAALCLSGTWRSNLEEWAAEDWNEDLSETKVFTASFTLASQDHIQPGQGVIVFSPLCRPPLTQSLVFTNSQQNLGRTHTHSYASAAANSYASAAAGTYAHAASSLGSKPSLSDVQKAEPVSVPRITPLSNQMPVALSNGSSAGEPSAAGPAAPVPLALSEPKMEVPLTGTHLDLKSQPDPSPILSQLTQHQNPMLLSDLPAQGRDPSPPLPQCDTHSPALKPLGEAAAPTMVELPQPKHIRPQRRRLPPPSKIPSSAVEMPGSADVSALNVQFGALDFASESAMESPGQSDTGSQESSSPAPQIQSSLYSKPSTVRCVGVCSLAGGGSWCFPSVYLHLGLSVPTSTPQAVPTSLPLENSMASSSVPSSSSSVAATQAPVPSTVLPSLSRYCPTRWGQPTAADVSGSLSGLSTGPAVSSTSPAVSSNGLGVGAPSLASNSPSVPSTGRSVPLQAAAATAGKAPPNLTQGVPPLLTSQYIMGPGGLLPAYPQIYGYEDLQMMQSRLPMDYYGMTTFPGATTLAARDGGLASNPYSGEATKFARSDAPSPAPTTSLSSVAPSQSEPGTVPPQAQAPPTPGQAFLNPPLPPGYGYTSLPYYAGMPGVPSAFQYGPTVFMPPASAKQHALGPSGQYQHQGGYGQHAYASAFDDLSQAHAGGDYGKGGYGGSSQSQAKPSNSTGKAPGLSGSTGSDLSATVYSKTQSFEKQGFPAATQPTFSLPSALGGTGPLNPGGAPGYAPGPFLHILPAHQQPPSQLMHHHMAQDAQGQRSQSSSMPKSQGKSGYSSSPYWAN
uniref:UBA domain-containing protein n=1 Tax=Electrophorus electricus TaxID=8005 RepID=A0A4W4E8Z6_ELEEL